VSGTCLTVSTIALDSVKSYHPVMDVQRAVLDAAVAMVESGGPDSVSMREVARRAGVSHQAPYHHFGDRAGIFAAISTEGFDILAREFRAALAEHQRPSRPCFEAYLGVALRHPGHFRVMFRADICGVTDHDGARLAADAAYEELLRMVRRTLGVDERAGGDELEVATWASLMWSVAHGFATLILDGPLLAKLPPGVPPDEHIDRVVTLMTSMVEREVDAMMRS